MIPTGLAWEDMLYPLYQKYKNAITWGDQDLLNIIFYFNPGRFSFENAVGGLLHPPPHPEHILALGHPWWSLNGDCVPCKVCPFIRPRGLTQAVLALLTQKAKCWNLQRARFIFQGYLLDLATPFFWEVHAKPMGGPELNANVII